MDFMQNKFKIINFYYEIDHANTKVNGFYYY
jgi:hypothetical protein